MGEGTDAYIKSEERIRQLITCVDVDRLEIIE
jgi:hypothetical protein